MTKEFNINTGSQINTSFSESVPESSIMPESQNDLLYCKGVKE